LVATVDHHDNPGLCDLVAPSADAAALADVLGNPRPGRLRPASMPGNVAVLKLA
jgi:hypothetical protein